MIQKKCITKCIFGWYIINCMRGDEQKVWVLKLELQYLHFYTWAKLSQADVTELKYLFSL